MIVITGATGFLGSVLARQIALQGKPFRCTKRANSVIPEILNPYQHLINWVDADILDTNAFDDALNGATQVYHCAAWVSLKQADKDRMIATNVTGTANVVNLCLENGARLLHVSSVAAVAESRQRELITENHHLEATATTDGYAISKLESEMEVWRGIAEGLDAVIVNPSIIIGPEAGTEGSGELFETLRKGLKFHTRGSIGFVDVEDVAACMISLMNSDIHAERFIISAENRTYKNITAEIAGCFGLTAPAIDAKPWMMGLAWRTARILSVLTGNVPFIDKVSAQSASVTRNFDNSKIKNAIAFNFRPLSESIAAVCTHLKQHANNK